MFCKNCGKETINNQKACDNCSGQTKRGNLTFGWWFLPITGLLIQFIPPLILHGGEGINGEIIARTLGFVFSSVQTVLVISLILSGITVLITKLTGKNIRFSKTFFIVFLLISVLITFFYIKGIQYEMQ